MLAFPPAHAAKASLVLTYDTRVEPTRAMATNVSLLKTRTLATRTTTLLGLSEAPDDFLKSVTIEPTGSEILLLTLTAPNDAEAVRRLDALTSTYLKFRGEQLSRQSQVLVDGLQARIAKLRTDVDDLSTQIEQLSAAGTSTASKLSDMISQRASILARIETLQQSVEDATLRNSSVVSSSRVLDAPAAEPGRAKRTVVLGLASGLIGGAALGCGTVLFLAITSDRLRRRSDVVSALGVVVPVSVGRIRPIPRAWRWLPPFHAHDRRRANERQRLAHAIEDELLMPKLPNRLAVAGIDNAGEVSFAVAAVARDLAARGCSITIIDLTERGSRVLRVTRLSSSPSDRPTVLRPRGLYPLANGVADLLPVGYWDEGEHTPAAQLSDVTLVLTELDPAVGADHLRAWTDRVMVVLTAGHSSVEKVRTVGDQIRAAGLELRFGALIHTDRTDDSSGTAQFGRPAPIQWRGEHESAESAGRFEAR